MTQLVKALSYKPEVRGFDSRWCNRNVSLTLTFRPHYNPWSTQPLAEVSISNILGGEKSGRCVGLTTLPPSYSDFLGLQGTSTSWNTQVLSGPVTGIALPL